MTQVPPPSTYTSVEAFCVYCNQAARLQVLAKTFEVRCARCSRQWPSVEAYCDVAQAAIGEERMAGLRALLLASRRASGGP